MQDTVFVCRTCGFTAGTPTYCPACDEPLTELTPAVQEEFQNHALLHNAVGMMQDKRWY